MVAERRRHQIPMYKHQVPCMDTLGVGGGQGKEKTGQRPSCGDDAEGSECWGPRSSKDSAENELSTMWAGEGRDLSQVNLQTIIIPTLRERGVVSSCLAQ